MTRTLVTTVFLVLALAPCCLGQSESLEPDHFTESLANRASSIVGGVNFEGKPPKILVWVCPEPTGPISVFAVAFARRLSESLLKNMDKNPEFAGRASVDHLAIDPNEIANPAELQSETIALRFATSRGYNLLVMGFCRVSEREVAVELGILRVGSNRKLPAVSGALQRSVTIDEELRQKVKLGYEASLGGPIDAPNRNGVTVPACEYCPNPGFHRNAKDWAGTILLRMIITPEGKAANIIFVKRLNPLLDDEAVKAVRTWRFKPATSGGRPVAVWTTIEINFRQYK